MKEEILKKLNLHEIKKSKVENDLGMPKNSLSAMLSGKKEIPSKWVRSLAQYIEKLDNPNKAPKEAKNEPEIEKEVESTQNSVEVLKTFVNENYNSVLVEPEIIDKVVPESKMLVGDSNSKFDQLLKQFNYLVDLTENPKDIKLKLEQIKESTKNLNLTPRQIDAIVDRCNHYKNNTYNQSKHSLKIS